MLETANSSLVGLHWDVRLYPPQLPDAVRNQPIIPAGNFKISYPIAEFGSSQQTVTVESQEAVTLQEIIYLIYTFYQGPDLFTPERHNFRHQLLGSNTILTGLHKIDDLYFPILHRG